MKYIDEFRNGELAKGLSQRLHESVHTDRTYRFMEFCGGHTHAIARYGLTDLLPDNVRMIHGPGCPVCVLPIGRIDQAIELALHNDVMLCTYGDVMRVPASDQLSLLKAKGKGADIRMVYSAEDALNLARKHPHKEVVFLAIGFETTTPPTALVIRQACTENLKNFSVLCNHVLTPSAITHIANMTGEIVSVPTPAQPVTLDGFVGPSHVSIIIGYAPYHVFSSTYHKPVVISGFEPLDVLQSVLMLVRQVNEGRAEVENQFTRAVDFAGNRIAQNMMHEVLQLRESFEWRGLGEIPQSALRIRSEYANFDAERRFKLDYTSVPDHRRCDCGAILQGQKSPTDCSLFAKVCTPENPMGSCMVSSEGACAAHYTYGRFRDIEVVASAMDSVALT